MILYDFIFISLLSKQISKIFAQILFEHFASESSREPFLAFFIFDLALRAPTTAGAGSPTFLLALMSLKGCDYIC